MKSSVIWATGVVAGVGLLLGGAAALAAGKNTNSEKVAKILQPAQEMLKSKNYNGALAKVHEAQALSDKTPFDQYTIDEFGCSASAGAANYTEAAKFCEAKLNDTAFMPEAEVPGLVRSLITINYQLKNYDKTIELAQRAVKGGFATEETKAVLGQTYYLKGDWKDTLATENAIVDSEIKAGQAPKDQQQARGRRLPGEGAREVRHLLPEA
jgi:hypothetical protein